MGWWGSSSGYKCPSVTAMNVWKEKQRTQKFDEPLCRKGSDQRALKAYLELSYLGERTLLRLPRQLRVPA